MNPIFSSVTAFLSEMMAAVFRGVYGITGNFYVCLVIVAVIMMIPDLISQYMTLYYQKKMVPYYSQMAQIILQYSDLRERQAKINALRLKKRNIPLMIVISYIRYFLFIATFFVLRHPETYFTFLPEGVTYSFLHIPDIFQIQFEPVLPVCVSLLSSGVSLIPFSKEKVKGTMLKSKIISFVCILILYLVLSRTIARLYFILRLIMVIVQYIIRFSMLPSYKRMKRLKKQAMEQAKKEAGKEPAAESSAQIP